MEIEKIWRQLTTLPPQGQREVASFIAFLQERYQRLHPRKHPKKLKLTEEKFIGLWQKRKDLQESTTWVRNIRKNEWAN